MKVCCLKNTLHLWSDSCEKYCSRKDQTGGGQIASILANLSFKHMWAFLIMCCPSSARPSVILLTFHIFIFFSRIAKSISTKLGMCPFPRGDNREKANKIIDILRNIFSKTTGQFQRNEEFCGYEDSSLLKCNVPPFLKGRSKRDENNEDVQLWVRNFD